MSSSLTSSSLYTSTVQPGPSGSLCQCIAPSPSSSSNFLSIFRQLCISCFCTLSTPHDSGCSSIPLIPLLPLTLSGFFNRMPELFEADALNYFTLSCFILRILSGFMNPTLTYLTLSGSLDYLLCDPMALTHGMAFILPITRTPALASSFLSGRAYPSLSFLPPLSLVDAHSNYVRSTSL